MRRVAALIGLILALGMAALAQDTSPGETSDNGFIIDFLQNRISAPGRQIRVHGVTGALSSRARIGEVTIADETGIWLRLVGVEMDWSRSQLLLGRVAVNRLAVERIDMLRRPVPPRRRLADRLPKVEAQPFRLPEHRIVDPVIEEYAVSGPHYLAVLEGRSDAVIDDLTAIDAQILQGRPLRVVGAPLFAAPAAVAVAQGDPEFAAEIARILAEMHADGTLSRLSETWFSQDRTTPRAGG